MEVLLREGTPTQTGGALSAQSSELTALVYYTPDLDLSRFQQLLAELRLHALPFERPALVDVKARHIFIVGDASLTDTRTAQAILDLHGDASAIVLVNATGQTALCDQLERDAGGVFTCLDAPVTIRALRYALRTSLRQILLHERDRRAQMDLDRRASQIADLHHVGVALSAVHDIDALQNLILTKARGITSADAGSLYLIVDEEQVALDSEGEPLRDSEGKPVLTHVKVLSFNQSQNFSNPSDFKAFRMPLSAGVAGHVATTGNVVQHDDIYQLPPDVPYIFNRAFDEQTGYRSKSMLAVPMINSDGQIIGVIQLINRKYREDVTLTADNVDTEVIAFSHEDRDLTLSFASQAAVALDNNRLIENIRTLFEGFVTAAVQAIESRDPTTSGHSGRVATLTVGLAEAINEIGRGDLAEAHFGPEDLREIRYASVLHDFGKVGVREHVLVKAKKLYDWQVQGIRGRFGVARAALESRFLRRKLEHLLRHGPQDSAEALAQLDAEFVRELAQLEASFHLVRKVNEPSVVDSGSLDQLRNLASLTYPSFDGDEVLIEPGELRKLSIAKGSLDDNERLEIESHVTHTYKFLTKIPWTHDLRRVPEIAWAHHEKLDGSGYPNGLTAEQIPLQSKMMTVADIFDALTAWDRPYKKAVPLDKALQILSWEANDGHIDSTLLEVFIEREIYRLTERGSSS